MVFYRPTDASSLAGLVTVPRSLLAVGRSRRTVTIRAGKELAAAARRVTIYYIITTRARADGCGVL